MAAKSQAGKDIYQLIYQLRAVLRGISPLVWRRLLVRRGLFERPKHRMLAKAHYLALLDETSATGGCSPPVDTPHSWPPRIP